VKLNIPGTGYVDVALMHTPDLNVKRNDYRGRRFTPKPVPNYSGNDYRGRRFTPKLVTKTRQKGPFW
jgi:hypothetical protein